MKIENNRANEIFTTSKDKNILIIGDIMMDEYLSGNVSRISPEAPVPVVEIDRETVRFGGSANVALNIKFLGCEPLLIGLLGKDQMGESFTNLMHKFNLNTSGLIFSSQRPTTVKTRIIGDGQHIARVDKENKNNATPVEVEQLKHKILEMLSEADGVVLQDYNKGVLTKEIIKFTIEQCNQKGLLISVDPKFTNFMAYKNTTIFKPNVIEAQQAVAKNFDTEEEVEAAGFELMRQLNTESILLTRGKKGLSLFEKDKPVVHIPTQARKVADVSGAGDTVISTMTVACLGGATKQEAALLANIAAGVVVEEIGIVPIYKNKLLSKIES
jgi:D-glycero-beta-D-manno-heptose-7-phosphate kinase